MAYDTFVLIFKEKQLQKSREKSTKILLRKIELAEKFKFTIN